MGAEQGRNDLAATPNLPVHLIQYSNKPAQEKKTFNFKEGSSRLFWGKNEENELFFLLDSNMFPSDHLLSIL